MSTKAIGVIPARWGSTRFPGKSLAMLGGKPVVQWVYERVRMARCLADVLVATDDDRIMNAVAGFGGRSVRTRSDHPSGTDRVAEAIAGTKANVIINIQGDEPLIDPATIDELAKVMVADSKWDMATAAAPIRDRADLDNPSVVKVVCGRDRQALYFSRSAIPFDRDRKYTTVDSVYWRHVGIYAYRAEFLRELVATPPCLLEEVEKLEQLRALHLGCKMKVIEVAGIGAGVDTPADLVNVEKQMKSMGWLK